MMDINTYRSRIGLFNPKCRERKFLYKSHYYRKSSWNESQAGKTTMLLLQYVFKFVLILGLLVHYESEQYLVHAGSAGTVRSGVYVPTAVQWSTRWAVRGSVAGGWGYVGEQDSNSLEICDFNFLARYQNGNITRKKGILNLHLNIRSLRNKVPEVKNVIKQHNPNIIGISECELKKDRVDEKSLKIPGYNILYPRSWALHGYARVVVYVKKTFKYQQVHELEDENVQSVWIKGGQRNSKNIYFCHVYREHLSTQGAAAQQAYLSTLLGQWEAAVQHGGGDEPNETHVCGDMNIDMYQGRWLQSEYSLVSLSRMIKNVCDAHNFHQLVKDITRVQFNSVSNTTDMSCIDHVYTNAKYRCSDPEVISFGDSDHDIVLYTRYSKNPPVPARIVCKRSYKSFDSEAFKADVEKVDC